MHNRELFTRDPLSFTLPNDGVAKVGEPTNEHDWEILKFELDSFVCEGEYQRGLYRILHSFLSSLDKPTQPAVWVSGFYGSGKSHLVRVLQYLWRDQQFPSGATARGLTHLSSDVAEQFKELSMRGRQAGGLWSAAGKLGGGAGDSIRLAVLRIVFQAAGLPSGYEQARFALWLKHEGIDEQVKTSLVAQGKTLDAELNHLYVSTSIANAVLQAKSDFAQSQPDVLQQLKAQFPRLNEISEEDFLHVFGQVLQLKSNVPGRQPLMLLVLDELEQYVSDNTEKMLKLQEVVEACSSKFAGSLLLVATGQSALQATAQLSKLKDRFTLQVELSSSDVETVIRQVALRKQSTQQPALEAVLGNVSGEIDRQLGGTKLAPTSADKTILVADYPLLPSRRRFWERVLRAIDRAGTAGQLRTQLKIVLEAARHVANDSVGTVVEGDFIYDQLRQDMIKSGVLSPEVGTLIQEQRHLSDGDLRARLAGLIFLIGKLPTEGAEDTGLRATAETLSDLMVRDLKSEGSQVRQKVPLVLAQMTESGIVLQVEREYRLQSKASSEWESDYRSRLRGIENDEAQIAATRQSELKTALTKKIGSAKLIHGQIKESRAIELEFTPERPQSVSGKIPVWVRNGWDVTEKDVRDEARDMGNLSPVTTLYIPRERVDELKRLIAQYLAATQVLSTRATPADRDGQEAKDAMESRQRIFRRELDSMIEGIVGHSLVLQGGGTEVVEGELKASVQKAAENAVERLFPDFKVADDKKWENVVKKVRAGNANALDELGHSGDADKHPVTQKILAFLSTPKSGLAVRKHFSANTFGWPQDAIDGALMVLVASGHLRAELDGTSKTAKNFDLGNLGKTQFRLEATVITLPQKLAIRKLLIDCGINFQNEDEATRCLRLVDKLQEAARSAGGNPPMPEVPNPPHLTELATLRGNDLLRAVFEQKDRLATELKEWRETKQAIDERWPQWETLERLLGQGQGLKELAEIVSQKSALVAHRGLLQPPDPVPPLLDKATDLLRSQIVSLHQQFGQRFESELQQLQTNPVWRKLEEAVAKGILDNHTIKPLPEPKLGNPQEVLKALNTLSLSHLQDRVAALPERFALALQEAIKLTTPQAIRIPVRNATLQTEEEVNDYLRQLREDIMQHIADGRPVIL